MPDRFPFVFKRGSLERFSFKERLTIRIADLAFYSMIWLIGSTLRFSTENAEVYETLTRDGQPPILAFWHERILASVYFFRGRGITVLTSKSMDGEYIARFITRFGFGAVRGSSSRGGVRALVEMIRLMREGVPMGFTVDGPRGPRHEAKGGPVMLAKKTGNPIIPFSIECSSYWQLKTWDRLQIPRPFARARVIFAEPISVNDEGGEDEVEKKQAELQTKLDGLVRDGERWRNGI